MRSVLNRWIGIVAVSGAAIVGTLATLDQADAAATVTGIRNTRHNLGTGGPTGNNSFDGTAEVCVFCHTPHGAATGAGNPPLWNKALPTGPYQVYNTSVSSTIDGATATDGVGSGAIGSVSIACLSCHDGTQAMNNFINQPGSGGYNAGGATMTGIWTAGTGPTPVDPATGRLANGATNIANLGTDLRNDHPIGIQYCGGGINGGDGTGTCRDSDFNTPSSTTIAGTRVFWVETGGNGTRNKTDMILYNRDFGASAAPSGTGPSVECASCHDPHVENVGNSNPTFLRISNAQSAVCLACHVK